MEEDQGNTGRAGAGAEGEAASAAADEEMDEEAICRYCLDGLESGPLLSPCNCRGGQKYVHLSCLRQWQRMVLVSQPTHPDFYGDDARHQMCNVCKGTFSCPPPTRHELMESFTGPEIAALIEPGCIIGAHEVFSHELQRKLNEMPQMMRPMTGYENWINGVYVITGVEVEDGVQWLRLQQQPALESLRAQLGEDLVMNFQGNKLRLVAEGSLSGRAPEELAAAFKALKVPCEVVLVQDPRPTCGDDHIAAVNVTRQLPSPPQARDVARAVEAVATKHPKASQVELSHFIGGPCEPERIVTCLVLGGAQCGWKPVKRLDEALQLACSLAARRCPEQGDFGGGQTVRVVGLKARPDLNGEVGLALRFVQDAGRWTVRLRNGDGVKVKPANLEGLAGAHGQVYAFWGDARWSRTQLLGEIARGHWGLCRASTSDLTLPVPERWGGLEKRMAFAPQTAMTEDFMREGERQMAALRAQARNHGIGGEGSGEEGEQ